MAPSRVHVVLVLGICLVWPSSVGSDIIDRMVPLLMPRMEELRKSLVPVPDEMLEEATFHLGSYYIPVDAESQPCRNHSAALFESFLAEELWALKIVDASSKLPSGVMDGHVKDLGSYDQCLSVTAPGGIYTGKHCSVETKGLFPTLDAINSETYQTFLPVMRLDAMISLCVPSSCSAQDVKVHLDTALSAVNATAILSEYNCSSNYSPPFSLIEWVAIVVLVGLIVLIIYSTVHDSTTADIEKKVLLVCFSLKKNIPKMLDTSRPDVAISCLNGLRVLGITWIIFAHRLLYMLNFPNLRFKRVTEMVTTLPVAPLQAAQLSVEIFFLMSAVLMVYTYMRYRQKGYKLNLIVINLLRYIRMTPVYALVILLYVSLLMRVSSGPLGGRNFNPFMEQCQRKWWAGLLYINNYVDPYDICVPHSWYIMADYQLHVVMAPLLGVLYKRPRVGMSVLAVCLFLTTVAGLTNAYSQRLHAGGPINLARKTEQNVVKDYIITHRRAASFFIGMVVGYLVFKIKQGEITVKLSKLALTTGWLISLFMILFSILMTNVFDQDDHVYSPVWDSLFLVLQRHIFSLGLSWIIIVCSLGYGGWVERFLSWRGFTPFARLTFCTYLSSVIVQTVQCGSMRVSFTLTVIEVLYMWVADFVISFALAAIMFLAVEAPVIAFTDTVLRGKLTKPKDEVQPETPLPVFKTLPVS